MTLAAPLIAGRVNPSVFRTGAQAQAELAIVALQLDQNGSAHLPDLNHKYGKNCLVIGLDGEICRGIHDS
jgi:hypothetical protein